MELIRGNFVSITISNWTLLFFPTKWNVGKKLGEWTWKSVCLPAYLSWNNSLKTDPNRIICSVVEEAHKRKIESEKRPGLARCYRKKYILKNVPNASLWEQQMDWPMTWNAVALPSLKPLFLLFTWANVEELLRGWKNIQKQYSPCIPLLFPTTATTKNWNSIEEGQDSFNCRSYIFLKIEQRKVLKHFVRCWQLLHFKPFFLLPSGNII